MSEPKFQELFGKLKDQEKAFDDYWMALRSGIRDFRNKVHELMGYPTLAFADQNAQARRWVVLAEKESTEAVTEMDLVRLGGDDGVVEFSIGLTLTLPDSPSDRGVFWYKYSIRKIFSKIELRSLDREEEIFFLDTEDGLQTAAEWLIRALERDLLPTPQSLWQSEYSRKKESFS